VTQWSRLKQAKMIEAVGLL